MAEMYVVSPKKEDNKLMAVTLSNLIW